MAARLPSVSTTESSVLNVTSAVASSLIVIFFGSGAANPLLRRLIISRVNLITGGRTELRTLSIGWFSLQVKLHGLVIHGREPEGTEPLFSAEEVLALRKQFLSPGIFLYYKKPLMIVEGNGLGGWDDAAFSQSEPCSNGCSDAARRMERCAK